MTTSRLHTALEHLQQALAAEAGGRADRALLERFIASRDQAAFAALVQRHGPMVLGVCRRLLPTEQDAEDAFQATFLILARKAAAVRNREAVGSWLYRVAYRTAREASAAAARRRQRERQVEEMPHPEVMPPEPQDWRPLLDRELDRLPEKYRAAVVLCDLEGLPRREVARQLGLAEGTLSSRLATARQRLARRLARYGLALSGAALAAAVSSSASASVPAALALSTTKAAALAAACPLAATPAAVLAKGVLKSMYLTKLKWIVTGMMVVAVLGLGWTVHRASMARALAQEARAAGHKPRTELEALRRENELLKLNVEVLLEKVRAQEAELQSLRAPQKGTRTGAGSGPGMGGMMPPGTPAGMGGGIPGAGPMPGQPGGMPGAPGIPQGAPGGMPGALGMPKGAPGGMPGAPGGMPGMPGAGLVPGTGAMPGGPPMMRPGGNKTDPLGEAEAALHAVRKAKDAASRRRAITDLERALKKLRKARPMPPGY